MYASRLALLLLLATACRNSEPKISGADLKPEFPEKAQPPSSDQANSLEAIPPEPGSENKELEARGPHGFSVRDLLEVQQLSELALSPDQSHAVFRLQYSDLSRNKSYSNLWRLDLNSNKSSPWAQDIANESSPQWAPDGKSIYYLSTQSGSQQIWQIALDQQKGTQVTYFPIAISSFRLSPNGKHIAFTAELSSKCKSLDCNAQQIEREKHDPSSALRFNKLFARHWTHWKEGQKNKRRERLAVLDLGDASKIDDSVRILSADLDADIPSQPYGGREDYIFTPDNKELVFTARVATPEKTEAQSTNFDLYRVAINETKKSTTITTNPAWDTAPKFSPDGKHLAYLAMPSQRVDYESDSFRLVLRDWPSGKDRVLSEDLDRSIRDFVFSPDGDSIYALAQDEGRDGIYKIDINKPVEDQKQETGPTITRVHHGGHVSNLSVTTKNFIALHDDFQHPTEVWQLPLDTGNGEKAQALTHVNDKLMSTAQVGATQSLTFKGANNEDVHAWLVQPANFDAKKTYPLAFLIHGGPQGSFTDRFHSRWNPQIFAGAGYAVVMVNFHGSKGYGQAFTDSIHLDWGGKPLEDLKKAMAHLAKSKDYKWIDTQKSCAIGGSYGGYMINWISSQWPDGFKCLVNHAGIFDLRSFYYSTEELWFPEWDFEGEYFQSEESIANYERFNPVHHVKAWKTPTLVTHGGQDFRVPLEQGLAAFTALQRQGIESELLYFPDEGHWITKPSNRFEWGTAVLGWFDRYLE